MKNIATLSVAIAAVFVAGCSGYPKNIRPLEQDREALKNVSTFYAAPVVYDFEVPADWEITDMEWRGKTGDFSEAFVGALKVTRRAPIEELQGNTAPPDGAIIELFIDEVDLGYHAIVTSRPAVCWGVLLITDSVTGDVLLRAECDFATPGDAGHQWYTYGGRLSSAHQDFAVDVISFIQRTRNE